MQQYHLGNYRVIRLLERGSVADRYLGEHIYLGTQATIETLHQEIAAIQLEPFLAEMRQVVLLKHPHIARVLEFGVQERTPFLVLNCVSLGTLRQSYPRGTQLPLQQACNYVYQVALALQYAHNYGLLHRDVRPEHMLLGENQHLWLSAFSLTILKLASSVSLQPEYLYSAPEHIQGHPVPASDQYALAAVLYEWLSGQPPFPGPASEALVQRLAGQPPRLVGYNPELPRAVESVIMQALNPRPDERFASMRNFAQALEQASGTRITSELSGKADSSNTTLFPAQDTSASDWMVSAVHPNTVIVQVTGSTTHIPSSPASPGQNRKRQAWRVFALALLFMLVIGMGVGGDWLYLRVSDHQPPTATAMRSPLTLYQQVTGGKPVLDDSLSSSSDSTWQEYRPFIPADHCLFKNGQYEVSAEEAGTTACLSSAGTFSDFAFQVELTKIVGSNAGLVFRSSTDGKQSYAFSLAANGSAFIIQLTQNSIPISLSFGQLVNKRSFPLFMTVIAQGAHLSFYVNSQPVKQILDGTLISGEIGLVAWDRSGASGASAEFCHARLWKL